MAAIWARVRADLRTRWVAWLALTLAIGISGAVVLTAAAGARRTSTAFPRFLEQGHAEDILISTGRAADPETIEFGKEIANLPQVEVAARVAPMILLTKGLDLRSPYQFAAVDEQYGNTIDRPNVIEGRLPRQDRVNEVLINRAMAEDQDLEVGDNMDWLAFTSAELDVEGPEQAGGTPVKLRVVGIGVYPNEVVATAPYDTLSFMYLTPAFFDKYPNKTHEYAFEVIRLHRGKADVPAFHEALNRVLREHGGSPQDILFADRTERNAQVQRAIQPQAIALWVFAALTGAAFLMVIVQVLARQSFLDSNEYPALTALGMSRHQLFATAMARVGVVAFAGAVIAVIGAALASPLMPIGPARLAEPNRGFAINVAILGLGFVAMLVLFVGLAAIPAWRAAGAGARSRSRQATREARSWLPEALTRAGFPASAVIGVRNAVLPGRGRTRVPVRSALVVSGVAIALFVGTFAFTSNLDQLANTPRLYGWDWTFKAGNGFFPVDVDTTVAKVQRDPAVEAVAGANYGALTIAGRDTAAVGVDSLRGEIFPTLLEGRQPVRDNEIVLGTRTLRRAHASVGETIQLASAGEKRTMRVVGRAVFPKLGAGSFAPTNLGEGAATTANNFADPGAPDEKYSLVLIRLRPGADVAAAQARMSRILNPEFFCGGDLDCVKTAERPGDISNFTRVRGTSLFLAAAMALIALGLLVHVLVSSVRRRRRDLAVLKTLGFVRRQVSAVTAWQATTMASLALLIGIPVGIALGSVVWRLFAGQLGVSPEVSIPVLALVLAVPATIVLANLIAAVPALLAARTRPAAVLRSE